MHTRVCSYVHTYVCVAVTVVWSSVDWCGVVWCGVGWCGVVWGGVHGMHAHRKCLHSCQCQLAFIQEVLHFSGIHSPKSHVSTVMSSNKSLCVTPSLLSSLVTDAPGSSYVPHCDAGSLCPNAVHMYT